MTSLASKYQYGFGTHTIDIEEIATYKHKKPSGNIAWIFEDGSALMFRTESIVSVDRHYDVNTRNQWEPLR